ncbi:DUF4468 domain-containing protein [Granulosicoccus sp. 3-233]|uniref:DUF4468 domain-containing protein n=1 Tax=Granulosicoccus sp. 3-233 TaxID=3417969 RepID=UPI003D3444A4
MKMIVLATVVAIAGCATTSTPFTGPPPMKIVESNAEAAELFHGSRQWIAENFKSANAVIQYQDEATNTVIGRGTLPNAVCRNLVGGYVAVKTAKAGECIENLPLEFVMKVEAKDNRLRVSMPSARYIQPATGYIAASEGLATQEIMDAYKDEILGYGDKIAAYVVDGAADDDW